MRPNRSPPKCCLKKQPYCQRQPHLRHRPMKPALMRRPHSPLLTLRPLLLSRRTHRRQMSRLAQCPRRLTLSPRQQCPLSLRRRAAPSRRLRRPHPVGVNNRRQARQLRLRPPGPEHLEHPRSPVGLGDNRPNPDSTPPTDSPIPGHRWAPPTLASRQPHRAKPTSN